MIFEVDWTELAPEFTSGNPLDTLRSHDGYVWPVWGGNRAMEDAEAKQVDIKFVERPGFSPFG